VSDIHMPIKPSLYIRVDNESLELRDLFTVQYESNKVPVPFHFTYNTLNCHCIFTW